MNSKFKLFTLLLFFASLHTFSQQQLDNFTLKITPDQHNKRLYIARFFTQKTGLLTEYWTLSLTAGEINANNFSHLKESGKILPHGKHYRFYKNIRPSVEINYEKGIKKGKTIGYYESGEVRYKGNYNRTLTGKLTHHYKNGKIYRIENMQLGLPKGEMTQFFPNGNIQIKASYKNGAKNGKYLSFHKNGELKREAKFEMDKLISQECFNSVGEKIKCTSITLAPILSDECINIKPIIEEIDFTFNKNMRDTATCRIILKIDMLGNASLVSFEFPNKNDFEAILNNWLNQIPSFTPAKYDGEIGESLINISFPVSEDQILWFGESISYNKTFRDSETQEDNLVCYFEFPLTESYECVIDVDNMPQFPGGDKAMIHFIQENIEYPMEAMNLGIQGIVRVNFVITPNGSVAEISVLNSIHPSLDAEAYRIISLLPNWIPAMCEGKPVPFLYEIPIKFQLTRDGIYKKPSKPEKINYLRRLN